MEVTESDSEGCDFSEGWCLVLLDDIVFVDVSPIVIDGEER